MNCYSVCFIFIYLFIAFLIFLGFLFHSLFFWSFWGFLSYCVRWLYVGRVKVSQMAMEYFDYEGRPCVSFRKFLSYP